MQEVDELWGKFKKSIIKDAEKKIYKKEKMDEWCDSEMIDEWENQYKKSEKHSDQWAKLLTRQQ